MKGPVLMINETMKNYGNNRSVIRDLFEFGNQRKAVVGADNVLTSPWAIPMWLRRPMSMRR